MTVAAPTPAVDAEELDRLEAELDRIYVRAVVWGGDAYGGPEVRLKRRDFDRLYAIAQSAARASAPPPQAVSAEVREHVARAIFAAGRSDWTDGVPWEEEPFYHDYHFRLADAALAALSTPPAESASDAAGEAPTLPRMPAEWDAVYVTTPSAALSTPAPDTGAELREALRDWTPHLETERLLLCHRVLDEDGPLSVEVEAALTLLGDVVCRAHAALQRQTPEPGSHDSAEGAGEPS